MNTDSFSYFQWYLYNQRYGTNSLKMLLSLVKKKIDSRFIIFLNEKQAKVFLEQIKIDFFQQFEKIVENKDKDMFWSIFDIITSWSYDYQDIYYAEKRMDYENFLDLLIYGIKQLVISEKEFLNHVKLLYRGKIHNFAIISTDMMWDNYKLGCKYIYKKIFEKINENDIELELKSIYI